MTQAIRFNEYGNIIVYSTVDETDYCRFCDLYKLRGFLGYLEKIGWRKTLLEAVNVGKYDIWIDRYWYPKFTEKGRSLMVGYDSENVVMRGVFEAYTNLTQQERELFMEYRSSWKEYDDWINRK